MYFKLSNSTSYFFHINCKHVFKKNKSQIQILAIRLNIKLQIRCTTSIWSLYDLLNNQLVAI
jgi:hypothetical protein